MTSPLFTRVLVDTGPLVALLRERERHHRVCRDVLSTIQPPLLTAWPVITEAAWLLRDRPRTLRRLYDGERAGIYRILHVASDELAQIAELFRVYENIQPQLADLTLIRLAHRERIEHVFTLDRRDFRVFRSHRGQPFQLLPDSL